LFFNGSEWAGRNIDELIEKAFPCAEYK